MKVSKKIDPNTNLSDAEKVDNAAKDASASMEAKPINGFDSKNAWSKIALSLSSRDKRFVTWGIALAASISLVMATNHLIVLNLPVIHKKVDQISIKSIPSIKPIAKTPRRESQNKIASLESLSLPKEEIITTPIKHPVFVSIDQSSELGQEVVLDFETTDLGPFIKHPLLNPVLKFNVASESYSPEFGIEFKFSERYTAKRREIIHIGLSSELTQRKNQEGNSGYITNTFATIQYQNLKKLSNNGWGIKGSVLLHSTAKDSVVKIALFKKFKSKIRVGTEFQYDSKSQSITPGLTLILG